MPQERLALSTIELSEKIKDIGQSSVRCRIIPRLGNVTEAVAELTATTLLDEELQQGKQWTG